MSACFRAPGKLILSGEHAVVHGRPALVMAVDRHAEAQAVTPDDGHLHVSLPSFCPDYRVPMNQLASVTSRLRDNYQRFLDSRIEIRDVMEQPFQLIAFALASLLDRTGAAPPPAMRMDMTTDIPVGCGMGSSAAVILAALGAMAATLNATLTKEDFFQLAWDAEKLQHGKPSGVDPWICCHGGCARFQQGRAEPVTTTDTALHLVQTGVPEATTGECVMEVTRRFKDHPIWDRFEQVTHEVEAALTRNAPDALRAAIRANHRLLCEIGVVPERVQQFIRDIERSGGSAKICGAGSIRGEHGGIALIFADEPPVDLCHKYRYTWMTVTPDDSGLTDAG